VAESRTEQEDQQHSNRDGGQPANPAQDGTKNRDQNPPDTEDTELRHKPPSRKRFFIIGAVVLIAIAAFLYWWHSRYYESTDDAQIDGRLVQISSRIKGYVTVLNVEENQEVKKGQLLVEIDPHDMQAALDQGEANLATAKANYEAALANVPITVRSTGATLHGAGADVQAALSTIAQSEKQLDAAQAQVFSAEANNTKAQLDLERYTPLVKQDVVSKQQYDAVVAAAASQHAQLAQAQANLAGAHDQVTVAKDRLAAAQANYHSAGNGPRQVAAERARADAAARLADLVEMRMAVRVGERA